jgi:hypothetical protein
MAEQFNAVLAAERMTRYLDGYDTQGHVESYTVETFIEDMIYGVGVAIDPEGHVFAQGFRKFKTDLLSASPHLASAEELATTKDALEEASEPNHWTSDEPDIAGVYWWDRGDGEQCTIEVLFCPVSHEPYTHGMGNDDRVELRHLLEDFPLSKWAGPWPCPDLATTEGSGDE